MCELVVNPAKVWRETQRKARKEHTCDVCREPVQPRALYVNITSMAEGNWFEAKLHPACRRFTANWQLTECGQPAWTAWPSTTPLMSIWEHLKDGEIEECRAISVWLEWMRARFAEDEAARNL